MQRYEAIESGIARNDTNALKEALGSLCYTCRDFSNGEFDEAVAYVEAKGIKIKDEKLIGDLVYSSNKSSYTDMDFAKAIFELKKNFCNERIIDVKKIGKVLYSHTSKQHDTCSKHKEEAKGKSINPNRGQDPNLISHQNDKTLSTMVKENKWMVILVAAIIVIIVIVCVLIVG